MTHLQGKMKLRNAIAMPTPDASADSRIGTIAAEVYATLAHHFPICCASDEFYFFPQALGTGEERTAWDDFSPESITTVTTALRRQGRRLARLQGQADSLADRIDCDLLRSMIGTLCEQLGEVAPHRSQPTFHLTVVSAGLAEALTAEDPHAWTKRIDGLPRFLARAGTLLARVPVLFRQLGLAMLEDVRSWLLQLQQSGRDLGDALAALDAFGARLMREEPGRDWRLPRELFERVVTGHLGCEMDLDTIRGFLADEFREMQALLQDEADRLAPGRSWIETERQVPFVEARGENLLELYREELRRSLRHCVQAGLAEANPAVEQALTVAAVPTSLAAVRASDAYSARPGHPPRGGTFFVMEQGRSRGTRPGRSLEYRMTAAHETWPGHHLLDCSRWGLTRPLRRPLETPLFYEGWACLAEELMARTGYFDGPWDRFLLARRRLERAARGLVDIGLQSGRMQQAEAVALLADVGYRRQTAAAIVPKYLLRPGYQVCYTLGLRQGLALLDRFGHDDIGRFARALLEQGEIGFDRLEKVLTGMPQDL